MIGSLRNWLAIVNPRAGGIGSGQKLASILAQLRAAGAQPVLTEYPGHARELASRAASCDGVVIAAGDGTLCEVLNARDRPRKLALIPCGRGNSLARDLGVYPLARGFQAIRAGHFAEIDLMEAAFTDREGRDFRMLSASTIAVGYPTDVVRIAGARYRWLGKYCYAAAAAALAPVMMDLRASHDTRAAIDQRLTGLIANNTRYLGNFAGVPGARCHDGYFDVMEMRAGFLRQSLHNISALSPRPFYTPANFRPMRELSLRLRAPHDLMVDGEIFPGVQALRIVVRKSAIAIAVCEPAAAAPAPAQGQYEQEAQLCV